MRFCSSRSPCATRHLSVLVSPLHVFLHIFFLVQVMSPVSLRASPHPQRGAAADPTPPLGLRFCRRRRISRSVPLRRISNVSFTAVRKWQRASTSGLADCRLQEGRELEIGKIASAGFLMCLSYLTCLACWLFSLLYAAICFFLYCASLWVTLYDNSRHVLGYGRKTKGFGNWKGGFFRRGTVGQTRRRECTKNRTWPHTSLLYNVRLSIDTTSFTR